MQLCRCHSDLTSRTAYTRLRVNAAAQLRWSSRYGQGRAARSSRCCRPALVPCSAAGAALAPQAVEESQQIQSVQVGGPGAQVDLHLPRRRLQISFTCNKCGARSDRIVNPLAWEHGTVFLQCAGCEAWHNVRDAAGLIEEVKLAETEAGSTTSMEDTVDTGRFHHAAAQLAQDAPHEQESSAGSRQEIASEPASVSQPAEQNGLSDNHHESKSPVSVRDGSAPIPAPENVDCGDEEACELDW